MSDENLNETVDVSANAMSATDPVEVMPTNGFPSPVLNDVPSKLLPKKDYACLHCPNAIWFMMQENLHCFCNLMRCETCSTDSEDAPLMCDGMLVQKEE